MSEWTAHGDVNPLDYGGQWVKSNGNGEYLIVSVRNMQWDCGEDGYLLESALIGINDSWIDKNSISAYSGEPYKDNPETVINIFEYWGSFHCGGDSKKVETRDEAIEFIRNFGIEI